MGKSLRLTLTGKHHVNYQVLNNRIRVIYTDTSVLLVGVGDRGMTFSIEYSPHIKEEENVIARLDVPVENQDTAISHVVCKTDSLDTLGLIVDTCYNSGSKLIAVDEDGYMVLIREINIHGDGYPIMVYTEDPNKTPHPETISSILSELVAHCKIRCAPSHMDRTLDVIEEYTSVQEPEVLKVVDESNLSDISFVNATIDIISSLTYRYGHESIPRKGVPE